mmetsp:Transcript_51396/g.142288  ORF Transcript_51396/g.142288 Transcript_51396/m.142288 type:complete len:146 (+) Transcript_51396:77-514(+)
MKPWGETHVARYVDSQLDAKEEEDRKVESKMSARQFATAVKESAAADAVSEPTRSPTSTDVDVPADVVGVATRSPVSTDASPAGRGREDLDTAVAFMKQRLTSRGVIILEGRKGGSPSAANWPEMGGPKHDSHARSRDCCCAGIF